jgi:lipopolysaccharide/colanic/teichoic acid biosynthesis glycosyltransferase
VAFSLIVLICTLPLSLLIILAIWIDDGRPLIFRQRRETVHGREFSCLKFRTMRRDAEQHRRELLADNQADGPQFFLENDPRCTRVGRFLRATKLDEFPQFINVLRGEMSVVGPRPSPHDENRCSPEWREARLSVRPGITGLWQVMRTRRHGLDFQEWIRFDVEYVERDSWLLDLKIIFKTILLLAKF